MSETTPKKTLKKKIIIFLSIVGFFIIATSVLQLLTAKNKYFVTSTNILPSEPINIFGEIEVVFNKPLTEKFLSSCQINMSPNPLGGIGNSFLENTLTIKPGTRFLNQQTHSLSIVCDNNKLLETSFNTQTSNELTQEEINLLQTQLDREFGQEIERGLENQPWRKSLPLNADFYELAYSQVENKYLVHLKLPPNSPKTKEEISNEILLELSKIGAPTLDFVWR